MSYQLKTFLEHFYHTHIENRCTVQSSLAWFSKAIFHSTHSIDKCKTVLCEAVSCVLQETLVDEVAECLTFPRRKFRVRVLILMTVNLRNVWKLFIMSC